MRLICVGLFGVALLFPVPVGAAMPQPSAVFHGTVRVGGIPVEFGTVGIERSGDPVGASPVSFVSGEYLYVLFVPVVSLIPPESGPPPGSVEVGDSLDVLLNGVPMGGTLSVSDRGIVVRDDLSLSGWFYQLFGTAQGGSILLTVDGVALEVTTSPGDSADDTAAGIAAAINGDPNLQSLNISAGSLEAVVVTNGTVTDFDISDPGLGAPVPAVGDGLRWLLGALLVGSSLLVQHRRWANPCPRSGTSG